MEMTMTPVRLPNQLISQINSLIKKGIYINKSDAIRDAVRRLVLNEMVGIIPNTTNSVKEVKNIRKKLSKEKDLNEINKY
jgi:Arc/MetJ-type ribon-helix-helix transcriptional regulator